MSKLRNSRRDVPIWSHWCLVQGAACRMAALSASRGRHSGYTCLSGFFQRFSKKQLLFCSLQTLSFYCWKSFTTREPILNPTKTENEFPSKGKLEILGGKTSHANNPTQRSQQQEHFDLTEFWCLSLFRTSRQLQRARCHCSGYTGPRSPNACAPKTIRKIMKKHQNPRTQYETNLLEGIVERC